MSRGRRSAVDQRRCTIRSSGRLIGKKKKKRRGGAIDSEGENARGKARVRRHRDSSGSPEIHWHLTITRPPCPGDKRALTYTRVFITDIARRLIIVIENSVMCTLTRAFPHPPPALPGVAVPFYLERIELPRGFLPPAASSAASLEGLVSGGFSSHCSLPFPRLTFPSLARHF